MTKKCTFECNLCHDPIEQKSTGPTGHGVYFSNSMAFGKHDVSLKPFRETEHHICTRCLSGLSREFQRIEREQREAMERSSTQ